MNQCFAQIAATHVHKDCFFERNRIVFCHDKIPPTWLQMKNIFYLFRLLLFYGNIAPIQEGVSPVLLKRAAMILTILKQLDVVFKTPRDKARSKLTNV